MKKYIIIGLVVLFSGCADQLDLTPKQSVDQDLALSTGANVKRVLQGAYSEIRDGALYGGSLQLYAEMLGANGEVRWEGTYNQPREMFNKNIFVTNSFVEDSWATAYRAINVANNILASLDVLVPEDLFAIQVNARDDVNDMFLYYSLPEFGARGGDVSIQDPHFDYYEAGDERLTQFYMGAGEMRTAKWRDQFKNVKVVRLAEMYLTRAEANFRLNTSLGDSPKGDLNKIRQRVKLPPLENVTLEAILAERKVELAHEGQFLHDVKRTKGVIKDNSSSVTYNYDDGRLIFPIPQREMDANPALVQNPAYVN